MKFINEKLMQIVLLGAVFLLSACGGSSSTSTTTPAANSPAQGMWNGTTSTNRSISAIVLGDGTYYVIYSAANNPNIIDGFSQGTGSATASPGTFTSSNMQDFNFVGLGVNSATLSTSYTTKQSFNGTINYTGGTSTTFTSTYDPTYETVPTLSALAGSYTGTAVVVNVGNSANTVITVSSSGAISSSSNGCTITGSASPRSDGNAFDVSMTFAASGCDASLAGKTLAGMGYFDSLNKQFYIAAPNAARTGGVFYLGAQSSPPTGNTSTLVGTLRGPVGAQVVLQNNGADDTTVTVATPVVSSEYNETSFAFATVPASGAAYAVTLSATSASQTCSVYKGASGTIPVTPTSVRVGCEHTYDMLSRSTDNSALSYGVNNNYVVIGGNATTGDGRYVAFVSYFPNLASGNTSAYRQVFWRDRQTGQTLLVSANSSGVEGNNTSEEPAISADGQKVAFASYATNLVAGDTNVVRDVFIWSAANPTGGVQRVSVSAAGDEGNGGSYRPTVSGDGTVVAFNSGASNLTSGVTSNSTINVIRRDLAANTNTLVSANSSGTQEGGDWPSISEDGARIAFYSYSSNLVTGDSGLWDIFVYDTTSGITRVSLTSTGAERNQGTESASRVVAPTISGNGRYVAYSTTATNVVTGDTGDFQDVFVVDTQTQAVVRASVTSAGVQGDANSPVGQGERVALSYDGAWVAFNTSATNLGTTADNAVMHNILTGETRAVTSQSGSWVSYISMSRSAAYVAFGTGSQLDSRFASSGLFARYTGVDRAWWWID